MIATGFPRKAIAAHRDLRIHVDFARPRHPAGAPLSGPDDFRDSSP